MPENFELWSLPWHALQQSLAKNVGETPRATVRSAAYRTAGAHIAAPAASNWLTRALASEVPAAVSSARQSARRSTKMPH